MPEQSTGWVDKIKALLTENPDSEETPVGTGGRARYKSIDDRVSEMETGRRPRDGQSSDKANGY
jgi:hypothetical protein